MATIIGDNGNNTLLGTDESDTIDGRGGADRMIGLDGDDFYIVDNAGDRIIEEEDGGWDEVISSISYTLGDFSENLRLTGTARTGTGNHGTNEIFGNAADNVLRGLGANDYLYGGEGADRMVGGLGDDTYYVDNVGDTVEDIESSDRLDVVHSTVSFRMSAGIDELYLEGQENINGTGNAEDNTIAGNNRSNRLRGLEGDDILVGEGGRDFLEGGAGNDVLDGGNGFDVLTGGGGDDAYRIDEDDTIVEKAGGGRDTIIAYSNYTLSENGHVENLDLSEFFGDGELTGIGNSGDNVITGRGGDTLRGEGGDDRLEILYANDPSFLYGGAGNDYLSATDYETEASHMEGGAGNDSYEVGRQEHWSGIVELAGGGIDTVYAHDGGTLTANLENLVLLAPIVDEYMSTSIGGGGNELNNRIINQIGSDGWTAFMGGAGGDDYLQGFIGSENYTGGEGEDQFAIASIGMASFEREQTIHDFTHGVDEILLDNALFANIGPLGALNARAFHNGTEATTARHRVIYNEAEGALYYDRDGTGAREQTFLLRFGEESTTVDASDFVVV